MVELATISPPSASLCNRWATFTASPITVYSSRPPPPITPAITCPVFTPTPMCRPSTASVPHPSALSSRLSALHRDRAPQGAFGVVVDRVRRAEHHHHRVALELVDHPQVLDDDLGHRREVAPDDLGDLVGRQAFGHRREAADVAEEHRHLELLAFDLAPGELLGHALRDVRGQRGRRGLLRDDGGVQPLHVVDRARAARARAGGHLREQVGDPPVDGLLGRARAARPSARTRDPATSGRGARGRARRSRDGPRGVRRSRGRPRSPRPRPRGSRGRARRPARSGPSAGRRARSAPCRGGRSRTPRRRAPRARRRPSPGASRGSRARSRSPRAGSSGAS